jgi:hypothetical protein
MLLGSIVSVSYKLNHLTTRYGHTFEKHYLPKSNQLRSICLYKTATQQHEYEVIENLGMKLKSQANLNLLKYYSLCSVGQSKTLIDVDQGHGPLNFLETSMELLH